MVDSDYSNSIKKVKDTSVPQTAPSVASANASSSGQKTGVVPVGKSDKPEEVIAKLIESNEFRNLSNSEKLAELKRHFPNADETNLKAILDNINAKIATTEPGKNTSKIDTDALISNIVKKAKELKLDIKLEDFEKLKNILTALTTGEKINPKEFFNAIKPFAKLIDNITPTIENWKDLTPEQRLNARFDALITFFMPEYQNMDDEKKAGIRDNSFTKIAGLMFPDINNVSDTTKKIAISTLANIIDMSESENLTLEKILNNPKEATDKVAGNIIDKWTTEGENIDFGDEKWTKLNSSEQLTIIIKDLVHELAPNVSPEDLKNLSFEEITKILNPIGEQLYGKEEWTKHPENCVTSLVTKLAAMKQYNQANPNAQKTFEEFSTNKLLSLNATESYENTTGVKLTPYQKLQREAYRDKLENSKNTKGQKVTQPNSYDMKAYLEKKLQDPNLSENDRKIYTKILKRINSHEKRILNNDRLSDKEKQELLNEPLPEIETTGGYILSTKYKTENGYDFKGYVNDYCQKLGIDAKDLTFRQKAELLNQLRDPSLALGLGKELGLANRAVIKLLKDKNLINDTARLDELDQYNITILMPHHDSKMVRAVGTDSAIALGKELDIPAGEFAQNTESWYSKDNPYAKETAEQVPALLIKYDFKKEYISDYTTDTLNNENIETDIKGILVDGTIKLAPDDDTRTYYGREFSQNVKDPDVLEYVGAASKYVENPEKRNTYNSYVTEAAKNYPPETQSKIQKAIDTGKISQETPSAKYQAANSNSNKSAEKTQQVQTNQPAQSAAQLAQTTPIYKNSSQTEFTQPQIVNKNTATQPPESAVQKQTPSSRKLDELNANTTKALEQKKNTALNHIEEYNTKVAAEQTAKEITDKEIEEFKDAIEQIDELDDVKIIEQKFKDFITKNSISAIYTKLIEKFGSGIISQMITAITNYGSSEKVDALASIIDGKFLEELFAKCQNKKLLDKLQASTIKKFIPMMKDLSNVRSEIMYEYIMELVNANANLDEIQKYLHYLPFGMQVNVCDTYNKLKGIDQDSKQALNPVRENSNQTSQADKEPAEKTKETKQQETPTSQPAIKANETTAIRNDGVQIKHKESFGAVSNNYDEEAYEEIITNQTGKTASQREEILTPGSYEWNLKYNKQQTPPPTAFTMAALEEDEEDNIGTFGSNKVGMGQKIKKKYSPKNFRFNA